MDQLVTEMTVKAGQKCTAIRRALVPATLADAITSAVSARLAGIVRLILRIRNTNDGPTR